MVISLRCYILVRVDFIRIFPSLAAVWATLLCKPYRISLFLSHTLSILIEHRLVEHACGVNQLYCLILLRPYLGQNGGPDPGEIRKYM